MGRAVQSLLPIPPIALNLRIGIAITSYADELTFGVIGDFDATVSRKNSPTASVRVSSGWSR